MSLPPPIERDPAMPQGHGVSESAAETDAVPARLWRATALQVAGRFYGSACTFVTLALLARALVGEDFGRYTFYLAIFALLDALVDFGTGTVAVRRSAADNWATAPVLKAARSIRLRIALVSFAAVTTFAFAIGEPGAQFIAIAALYPLTHVWELSATVFKNRLAWGIPVAIRAAAATFRLVAVFALLAFDVETPGAYLAATAAGSALANLLLHRAAWPLLPKPTIAIQPARGVFAEAWPLGIALIAQQAYFYVDNVFVRAIDGTVELGRYNAAVRVMSFLIMVAQYASLTGLPWLTRRRAAGDLGVAAARLGQPLSAIAGLGCGLALPLARPILEGLFGEPFGAATASLQWLLGATAAVYAGATLLTAVVSLGRPKFVLMIAVGALALNVVGNGILVPMYGHEGAAIATLGTEIAVAVASAAVLAVHAPSFARTRPWAWLLGPVGFALGAAASGAIAGH
ncbi:lipopolysaccharide biosynthesis protein [Engelhardtia mirabilis]|uniref:Polysaccharide biosynthesis protein n=1 Tax=Engelhardtia mirabilis TaxID=2528011 RepID=A0A518BIQ2_9BACT|nr:Polysaccharide biosynthesis protein [Planctomycetes bacterium Pla133]QDV01183.1 Polysaccharide biosynthesis protein [Planctomycetes bacterium Pla86]